LKEPTREVWIEGEVLVLIGARIRMSSYEYVASGVGKFLHFQFSKVFAVNSFAIFLVYLSSAKVNSPSH